MIKFYHAVREGWGEEHILTRFLKDGIWAFALPFSKLEFISTFKLTHGFVAMLVVNTFCMIFLKGAMASVAYS